MGLFASIRRWRAKHLAASWGVYWLGLLAVALGPAVMAAWRITRTSGNTISASFANGVISVIMSETGKTVYSSSATLLEIAAWITVPPLLLTGVWLALRPRRSLAPEEAERPQIESGMPTGFGEKEWASKARSKNKNAIDR